MFPLLSEGFFSSCLSALINWVKTVILFRKPFEQETQHSLCSFSSPFHGPSVTIVSASMSHLWETLSPRWTGHRGLLRGLSEQPDWPPPAVRFPGRADSEPQIRSWLCNVVEVNARPALPVRRARRPGSAFPSRVRTQPRWSQCQAPSRPGPRTRRASCSFRGRAPPPPLRGQPTSREGRPLTDVKEIFHRSFLSCHPVRLLSEFITRRV